MVVRGLEVLFEYVSIMLCIYRVAQKKFTMNIELFAILLLDILINQLVEQQIIGGYLKVFINVCILIYIRKKLDQNWKNTIEIYAVMIISIVSLQLVVYFICKCAFMKVLSTMYGGVIINIAVCVIIALWKKRYLEFLVNRIKVSRNIIMSILVILILVSFLSIYSKNMFISFEMALQFLLEALGLGVVSAFWIVAERENIHKAEEIKMYQSYTEAFEEAIKSIRIRQHEFENHINAIRCMQFTIKDREKLICAQEEYCDNVLKENRFNKLLSIEMEPILIGFLYSKFTRAYAKNIITYYKIGCVSFSEYIKIYELIELIGIIYDNAMEALEKYTFNKSIRFNIIEDENTVSIEIANVSVIYKNSEIEKFFMYGYSTKGDCRGIGLARAKEIADKCNATLQVQNYIYEEENYLSFRVIFMKRKGTKSPLLN